MRVSCINYKAHVHILMAKADSLICKSLTWQTLYSALNALCVNFIFRMFKWPEKSLDLSKGVELLKALGDEIVTLI